jgi:hypothetical protein
MMFQENINKFDLIEFQNHIIIERLLRLFLIRMRIFARLENHISHTFFVFRNNQLGARCKAERCYR